MNPVGLYFASGDSIYLGAALLVLSILFSPHLKHRRQLRLRNLSAWLALAMMVMASPPFPWTLVVMFLAAFVLWLRAVNQSASRANWANPRRAITAILLALLLILSAGEFSHRLMPAISGEPSDHLVVIGDSISSGIDPHVLPWPSIFQQMTGVPVKKLSETGRTNERWASDRRERHFRGPSRSFRNRRERSTLWGAVQRIRPCPGRASVEASITTEIGGDVRTPITPK
jgi:hypothetical protein